MIKDQMNFPLAVDTATVKATTNILYSATDDEVKAYTIGYIPWEMMQKSVIYRGMQYGDLAANSTDFKYTIGKKFRNTRGVPFCYSYAASPLTAALDAFNDGNGYIDLPWGTASTAGLLHAYNTDYIVNNTPNQIANTYGIRCHFKMLVAYVPEGGEGGASTSAGENGWCTWLADKNAYLDLLTLAFSVTSATDGGYMPTPVTFTQDDLRDAVNGIMSKTNGTTTSGGVTYNITVYCAVNWAEIEDNTATNLKDGFAQCDRIRASHVGGTASSPLIKLITNNTAVSNSFTCNAIEDDVDIQYPASTMYFIGPNEEAPSYFKFSGMLNQNWYIAGSLTLTDLKIIRSIARPIYKFNSNFYVAEFNDDFTITGELIPYSQARAWQKNINGDTNEFDPADIPDPSETDDEWDADFYGEFPAPSLTDVEIPADFITHWVCSKTGVAAFGSLLWKDLLDFDTTDPDNPSPIPKICQNIRIALANYYVTGSFDTAAVMDFILGLRYYPFDLSSYASDSSQNNIYFGTGRVGVNSGENAYRLNKMSIYIYGGYVNVKTAFETQAKGDWRDYADAEAIIFVPFCGSARVAIEDVWNRVVHIYYGIDLSSGAMSAYVYSYSLDGTSNRQLIACLNGLVGFEIPVTATNANRISAAVIGDLTNAANAFASPIKQDFSKAIGVMSGKMQGSGNGGDSVVGSGDVSDLINTATPQGYVASQGLRSVGGLASEAAGILTRPAISCPAMNGGAGWGTLQGPLEAAIQIRRCRYYDDSAYAHSVMHPFATKKRIGDMNGYGMTQCVNVDTSGLTCTSEEREMIASYLQSGVYL